MRALIKQLCRLMLLLVSLNSYATQLKVISYNILSPFYLECGAYDQLPHNVIDWELRKERILNQLIQSQADIICLQEIDFSGFQYLEKELSKHSFQAIYAANPTNQKDSVATFYQKTLPYKSHTIHQYPESHKSFLVVRFSGKKDITLVNTKFKWDNTEKPLTLQKGYQQSRYLVNYLQQHTLLHNTILCGDLNASDDSQVIVNLKHNFKDLFENSLVNTFQTNGTAKRIDYIMITPDLAGTPVINLEEQKSLPFIPSIAYPSDHLMIAANVEINDHV